MDRRHLALTLVGLAICAQTRTVWAQTPPTPQVSAEPQMAQDLASGQANPQITVGSTIQVGTGSGGPCNHLACNLFRKDSCGKCRTCVRVPVTKKTTSWNYEAKCVPTCIPEVRCSLGQNCRGQNCPSCARSASKRVQIKYKVVEETTECGFESKSAPVQAVRTQGEPTGQKHCSLHGLGCLGQGHE